jgi:hypothetical protein
MLHPAYVPIGAMNPACSFGSNFPTNAVVQECASASFMRLPRFSSVLFLGWLPSILSRICEEFVFVEGLALNSTGALLAPGIEHGKVYYSTTFAPTANKVWEVIGDFNGCQWAEGVGMSHIENRKPNNALGAIRDYKYRDHVLRGQVYTYESVEPLDTFRSYRQTLRVAPTVDTATPFVEWTTDFDAPAAETRALAEFLMDESAKSLDKVRTYLAEQ